MSHCPNVPLSLVRCPIVIRQLVDDTDTTPFRLGSDRIASHRNWSTPATLESEHHPPTPSTPTLTQSQPERQCRDVLSFIAHADVDGASWGSQVPNCFRLLQPVHSFFSLSLLLLLLLSSFFAAVFFFFVLSYWFLWRFVWFVSDTWSQLISLTRPGFSAASHLLLRSLLLLLHDLLYTHSSALSFSQWAVTFWHAASSKVSFQ